MADKRRILREIFSGYEACVADIFRAFQGSYFVGILLAVYYCVWFLLGLIIAAWVFEKVGPISLAVDLLLPSGADAFLDLGLLGILIYAFTLTACVVARTIVRILVYLCFEMRFQVLFNLLLFFSICAVIIFILSALSPPIVSETSLTIANGLSAFMLLILLGLVGWLYFRYRMIGNSLGRKFDQDIGLAWSHFCDPRRARLDFSRGA